MRVEGLLDDQSSALWRALAGGPHRSEREILADLADILAAANWQRSGDSKAPRPQPYPRPGDDRRAEERSNQIGARARAMKARIERNRRGG